MKRKVHDTATAAMRFMAALVAGASLAAAGDDYKIGTEPVPVSESSATAALDAFAFAEKDHSGEVDAFAFDSLESDPGKIRTDKPSGFFIIMR